MKLRSQPLASRLRGMPGYPLRSPSCGPARQETSLLRWCSSATSAQPATTRLQASKRVQETDAPCIVATKKLMAGSPGAVSLAQGIVHWGPPEASLKIAADLLTSGDPSVSSYGPAEGNPQLRAALKAKVEERNGLKNYQIMVTAGANQAFTNVVLGLMDDTDKAVLFKPYYFNHLMAFQMCGGGKNVVFGDCDPVTLHPDLDWLERTLKGLSPPKMVVLVNPCNPSGVLLTREEVHRASDLCAEAGAWLVLDNTYEDFLYEGSEHFCVGAPHVINIFSFSKAYGMMGWRVGYLAYPDFDGTNYLGEQILKVQDTKVICPTQISQLVALAALEHGGHYVKEQIAALQGNRAALVDALSPLGALGGGSVAGGEGAIYLWARLPPGCEDDQAVVAWLVKKHGVCVIPGSACGAPGHIRAAYANLKPVACQAAALRLKEGLTELVSKGMSALNS